jgi:hypothetical protein
VEGTVGSYISLELTRRFNAFFLGFGGVDIFCASRLGDYRQGQPAVSRDAQHAYAS